MSLSLVNDDPLLKGLNERQFEAATMPPQSAIILAGAGSGKTKVLTTRIAWLIREGKASVNEIMAVTFTNKAAKEMKDRLGRMTQASTRGMWIGTFHGLCHRMLRENAALAGLPQSFTIMDEDDQLGMIKRLLKEGQATPEDVSPQQIQKQINRWKEAGIRPSRVESDADEFEAQFYAIYEARCAREGVIDFTELMLRTQELFSTSPEFLDRYQNRFSNILVDEFQDTNNLQYDWLKTICGKRGVIFAVADDDQSIYAFRGSNPQNMMTFAREEAGDRIIRLEQNYRSTGAILSAANAVIRNNSGRLGKELWTDAGQGNRSRWFNFENSFDEANEVASTIKRLIQQGTEPSEIAVLYRSNYQSRGYEKALMAHGVPYLIYGGTRFYERTEIKQVLAYIRLTINVHDDGAFNRVINFPPRKIGDRTVEKIRELAEKHGKSMLETSLKLYRGDSEDRVKGFVSMLVDFFGKITERPLPEFMDYVINKSGIMDEYTKKEEKERVANLKEMVSAAQQFCKECGIEGADRMPAIDMIDEFLATATLESASDNGKDAEHAAGTQNPRAITLMTVHAAKGLEFDAVVLGGAEEGVFPSDKSVDEGNEEEERRLMYVAITRAKKNLFITSAKERMIYGQVKELEPSRFMAEIPKELLETRHFSSQNRNRQTFQKKPFYKRG